MDAHHRTNILTTHKQLWICRALERFWTRVQEVLQRERKRNEAGSDHPKVYREQTLRHRIVASQMITSGGWDGQENSFLENYLERIRGVRKELVEQRKALPSGMGEVSNRKNQPMTCTLQESLSIENLLLCLQISLTVASLKKKKKQSNQFYYKINLFIIQWQTHKACNHRTKNVIHKNKLSSCLFAINHHCHHQPTVGNQFSCSRTSAELNHRVCSTGFSCQTQCF